MESTIASFVLTESQIQRYRKAGKYFGYPSCCIDNVIDRASRGFVMTLNQKKVNKNTGFVPCRKCSKKIVDGEIKIQDLIKNRICKSKFPHEGPLKDFKTYMKEN